MEEARTHDVLLHELHALGRDVEQFLLQTVPLFVNRRRILLRLQLVPVILYSDGQHWDTGGRRADNTRTELELQALELLPCVQHSMLALLEGFLWGEGRQTF